MYSEEGTSLFCRSQMDEGEVLLWQGRPKTKSLCLSKYEAFAFRLGTMFAILSVFIFTLAWILNGTDPVIIGFLIFFPAPGVLIAAIAAKRGLRTRDHTEYAITNMGIYRRVEDRVDQFIEGLSGGYETVFHRDGTATITFTAVVDPHAGQYRVNRRIVIQTLRIVRIADIDAVHRALSALNSHSA